MGVGGDGGLGVVSVGGDSANRDVTKPDFGSAVMYETVAGIEVSAPITDPVTGETEAEIDPSKTGMLIYAWQLTDPDGNAAAPWYQPGGLDQTPFMCVEIAVAGRPGSTSGIVVAVGIMDGPDASVVGRQWAAAGIDFGSGSGPRPAGLVWNQATTRGAVAASGVFGGSECRSNRSSSIDGIRVGEWGGTLGANSVRSLSNVLKTPNDHWGNPPWFIAVFEVVGVASPPQTITFTAAHKSAFVKPA